MDELEELIENLDLENYRYFYHITSRGKGSETLERGLYMKDKHLYSTSIELPEEMINNPVSYCEGENQGRLNVREEMVIIQCEKGYENNLVVKSDGSIWNYNQSMKYVIPPENILCWIDLENLTVNYNYESGYYNGRMR